MPKIEPGQVQTRTGSSYPSPFDEPCRQREVAKVGDAAGLTKIGVNIVTLAPGAWASQRHWHDREDEFAYVLEGELSMIDDSGETRLVAGDCAGWPAGVHNGHHLVNKSNAVARFLIVSNRDDDDTGGYSDIDMQFTGGRYSGRNPAVFRRKDGTPY